MYSSLHEIIEKNNKCPICGSKGTVGGWRRKLVTQSLEINYKCADDGDWKVYIYSKHLEQCIG